ncbi:hypothetical protein ACU635_61045 [[Actinomadura] parvosata]|uniref:hypothetical protein n=1 Tax=[Actinomadura] parvosata TaxID=1955412 RepID=UPI00406CFDCB
MVNRGSYIAFLGIDGVGKTSFMRLLADALMQKGCPVRPLSWRKELEAAERTNTRQALRQLWAESLRLIHLGVDDAPAPASYDEFYEQKWETRYSTSTYVTNVPAGPLAAAWLEWVGHMLLRYEVIEPACAQGYHVLDDSFGLKSVLKELYIAERLSRDAATTIEIRHARETLVDLFRACSPDLGIVVTGSIDNAYRRRIQQKGLLGSLESMGAATGDRGLAGFRELQTECDALFRSYAHEWGWIHFEADDAPVEENFKRLRRMLLSHPNIGEHLQDDA